MPGRVPQPSDDVTVYLVLNDYGEFERPTRPRPIG
jgi:hypothetical protein